jgi:hypothetical protein
MNEQQKLALARQQLSAIKGFYIHLLVYVLVNVLLFVINAATGTIWWVQWPILAWGIGILGHAYLVFGQAPGALARWEKSKLAQLKRRLDEAESGTVKASIAPNTTEGSDRAAN